MAKMAAEWVEIGRLRPWPGNPRNNEDAIGVVAASLKRFGWGAPIVARLADGEIIGGHTRWAAAKQLGMKEVPVRFLDLTADEAHALALADNKTNEIATWDDDKLAAALRALQGAGSSLDALGFSDSEITYLTASLDETTASPGFSGGSASSGFPQDIAAALQPGRPAPAPAGPPKLHKSDVPDAVWPTNNEWGVPVLDLAMQADAFDTPIIRWGRIARTSAMSGTWHFYTGDFRFNTLWDDPSIIPNTKAVTVVEPNYSTSANMPRAAALWTVYKKRWLGRYWQSKGVRLIVDLNVAKTHGDLNWLGVPQGWRVYAIRGYRDNLPWIKEQYEAAQARAAGATLLFMVYGGNRGVRDWVQANGCLWLPEEMDEVHNKPIMRDTPAEADDADDA